MVVILTVTPANLATWRFDAGNIGRVQTDKCDPDHAGYGSERAPRRRTRAGAGAAKAEFLLFTLSPGGLAGPSQRHSMRFERGFPLCDLDHGSELRVRSHSPHRICTSGRGVPTVKSKGRMKMRFLIAAISAAALLVSANVAKADKRVAFVVGNGAYKNVAALPNPAVDAKSMAKLLRNVGFDVVEGANLTRDKMTEKLLDFGKKAEGADVALVFYACHRISVNRTDYLLPVH